VPRLGGFVGTSEKTNLATERGDPLLSDLLASALF
jgi:hypothetical protein